MAFLGMSDKQESRELEKQQRYFQTRHAHPHGYLQSSAALVSQEYALPCFQDVTCPLALLITGSLALVGAVRYAK